MKADGDSKRLLSDNVFSDSIIENVPGYVNVKSSLGLQKGLRASPPAARIEGLTDQMKSPIFLAGSHQKIIFSDESNQQSAL
jgi:hypothetical protein